MAASEILPVDITEITAVRSGLRRRIGHALSVRSGPPSLRAQIVLLLSAFLLGGVLSGLLFVGVWRHTAAAGDVAREEQLATAQRLRLAAAKLSAQARELHAAQAKLAATSRAARTTRARLSAVEARDRRVAAALGSHVDAIVQSSGSVERRVTKLRTALTSIANYVGSASSTGVDPAFVEAQVRYVIASTAAAEQAAGALAQDAQHAQAAAAALGR
ncbi:MAG TPA: hypothetical protein VFA24_07495 [Gaiellaceae bacterium]|nr:hypothetical protein [Gaiellaceae bacterium]